MSQVYNLEPAPTAKVILQTTAGDILLELFGKQCPLATQNFLQHCLDNTYNNTIFHRLVPDFIIQGGDPSGTGSGGHSAINDNEPFQDEFHSRLKFNRRGLLGMANEGRDSNGSQFFFTLAATPELQGKHTMFGRVEGDTIYNLMKMADVEIVEGTERPLYPAKITGTEILVNPFEGMVARVREAPRVKEREAPTGVKKRKKPGAGKNALSFGGEEGDEETAAPILKKAKANPKLVSIGMPESDNLDGAAAPKASKEKQERPRRRRTPIPSPEPSDHEETVREKSAPITPANNHASSRSSSPEPEQLSKQTSALDKTNAEIAALKASMRRNVDLAPKSKEKPKNALEAMIPATSTRGRKRGKMTDEKGALDVFKAFKQRLKDIPASSAPDEPATSRVAATKPAMNAEPNIDSQPVAEPLPDDEEEAALCDLHFIANCQSCQSWDDEDSKPDREVEADGGDDAAWMSHQLTFAKDTLGKDLEWKRKMKEIEVIDPREKAREIKAEKREEKKKRKRAK